MIDLRVRSKIPPEEMAEKVGKIPTEADYNVLLTGPCRVRKPNGQLLCIYLPGVLQAESEEHHAELTKIRSTTDNRGLASGMKRVQYGGRKRSGTARVQSSIVGYFDPAGPKQFCRLTAYTAKELDGWDSMRPFFEAIAKHFKEQVPDRYDAQMQYVARTHPDWVIPGTPFTTITINNTYPTGVHTDKGDLDQGFSTIACLRRGTYTGGQLMFPEYRVAVDLQDGDLILMDAHEWHGNVQITKQDDEAERITVVSYYRTNMVECDSRELEAQKAELWAETRAANQIKRATEVQRAATS